MGMFEPISGDFGFFQFLSRPSHPLQGGQFPRLYMCYIFFVKNGLIGQKTGPILWSKNQAKSTQIGPIFDFLTFFVTLGWF